MIVVSFISLNVELIILSRESICKTRDFIFSWFCLKKVSLRVLSIQKKMQNLLGKKFQEEVRQLQFL